MVISQSHGETVLFALHTVIFLKFHSHTLRQFFKISHGEMFLKLWHRNVTNEVSDMIQEVYMRIGNCYKGRLKKSLSPKNYFFAKTHNCVEFIMKVEIISCLSSPGLNLIQLWFKLVLAWIVSEITLVKLKHNNKPPLHFKIKGISSFIMLRLC